MKAVRHCRGFTLLEVLISMGVFSVVSATIAVSFYSHVRRNNETERRSEAIVAAQQVLDRIRTEDPVALPTTGSDDPVIITMGNRMYQVTATYCPETTYCTSNNVRHINVAVRYRGGIIYQVETVYAQLR